jgi:hypothetical protein
MRRPTSPSPPTSATCTKVGRWSDIYVLIWWCSWTLAAAAQWPTCGVTTVADVKDEIACPTMGHSWVDWMDGKDGNVKADYFS